jgi:two-component system NarL family response regulator
VLTVHAGEDDIARCLQAGARGYLLKSAAGDEIPEAIRTVHGGRRRIAPELSERLAEHMGAPGFTEREMDVLRRMAEGKDNRTIAGELGITEGTTKWYVTSIFSKLGVTDRTQAVVQAARRGLVRVG